MRVDIRYILCFLVWGNLHFFALAVEPLTIGAAVTAAATMSLLTLGRDFIKCYFYECCGHSWIGLNSTGLTADLTSHVHGQHLVIPIVRRALIGHYSKRPAKALVLSFHGATGTGKNFVSRKIVENTLKLGMKSKFVHLFIATYHFPHESKIREYKDQLRDWIRGNVSLCDRSIFIFDEMDKMLPGLIDTIQSYVEFHEEINGVDYRNATFIFLSNTGAAAINQVAKEYYDSGKKRTNITYKELESILTTSVYNQDGGLWYSSLIKKDLVSAYVPFLPLEREHILMCVKDDMRAKNYTVTDRLVRMVADELQYFPSLSQIYSKTGCKRVSDKVNYIMDYVL